MPLLGGRSLLLAVLLLAAGYANGQTPLYGVGAPGYISAATCAKQFAATNTSSSTSGSNALAFNVITNTSQTLSVTGIYLTLVQPAVIIVYYRVPAQTPLFSYLC